MQYIKTYNHHYTRYGKTQSISITIRNEIRLYTFLLLFSFVVDVLAREIRQKKETKGLQIRKEEIKIFFVYDMTVNKETLKIPPDRLER